MTADHNSRSATWDMIAALALIASVEANSAGAPGLDLNQKLKLADHTLAASGVRVEYRLFDQSLMGPAPVVAPLSAVAQLPPLSPPTVLEPMSPPVAQLQPLSPPTVLEPMSPPTVAQLQPLSPPTVLEPMSPPTVAQLLPLSPPTVLDRKSVV